MTAPWLQAYFTPTEQHSPEMKEALRLCDKLVAEILPADHIVVATPVYNYNVPAALKAWADHIVRKGTTLGFDGQGLVKGKKATVLLASGGVYATALPLGQVAPAVQFVTDWADGNAHPETIQDRARGLTTGRLKTVGLDADGDGQMIEQKGRICAPSQQLHSAADAHPTMMTPLRPAALLP